MPPYIYYHINNSASRNPMLYQIRSNMLIFSYALHLWQLQSQIFLFEKKTYISFHLLNLASQTNTNVETIITQYVSIMYSGQAAFLYKNYHF